MSRPAIPGLLALSLVSGCSSPTGIVKLDGMTVRPDGRVVEVEAFVCLDGGWLEQVACGPQTREHEALVVVEVRPSNLHAALLMAGFEPGSPGRWSYDDGAVTVTPPTGDPVEVRVRYRKDGRTVEEPVAAWMIGIDGQPFAAGVWVFAGSTLAEQPDRHYVADMTGSIIGLVTFGDEVLAFERVMADQEAVEPTQWQVNTGHVPPIGTPVTLILRAPGS